MAAHYIKEMRELQPEGPYFIGGRSLGGMIAFEMACQLRMQDQEVGLLVLLDTYPAGYAKLLPDAATVRSHLVSLARRIGSHASNLRGLASLKKLSYLAEKAQYAAPKIKSHIWRKIYRLYLKHGRPLPRALSDVKEFNSMAAREYLPRVFAGKVTLFWASGDLRASFDLVAGWRVLAGGGIDVHEISGNHLNIIEEPYVVELAMKLHNCLERAQGSSANKLESGSVFSEENDNFSRYREMKKAS